MTRRHQITHMTEGYEEVDTLSEPYPLWIRIGFIVCIAVFICGAVGFVAGVVHALLKL